MDNIMDDLFRKRIRRHREYLCMTREQFAELIGRTPQFLAEIENGTKGISAETLYRICKNSNASANYILFGDIELNNVETPIAKMVSEFPAEYSDALEDILTIFLKVIEQAENKAN